MMEISFKTNSFSGSYDILTPVLSKLKIKPVDIQKVELDYFVISNYPYEEKNVAYCSHPCEGSIGFNIYTNDGNRYLTEEIFFYDYNLKRNHCNGLPHWNHEARINGQPFPKSVEYHTIPDSPDIQFTVMDGDRILYESLVRRVPISEVRNHK